MWRQLGEGVELSGPKEAFEDLRDKARAMISEGRRLGKDVRTYKIRLSDEPGKVLFEGTIEQASKLEIDGRIYLPSE